jgi:hypothetical protein
MTKSQRDSAESLDVSELEELSEEDSGLRRVFEPRDAAPQPLRLPPPPPVPSIRDMLARAPEHDPDDDGPQAVKAMPSDLPPSTRLDLDDLVRDLTHRPAPAESAGWDIPAVGAPKVVAKTAVSREPVARRFPLGTMVGVAVVAYLLGVSTPSAMQWLSSSPERAEPIAAGQMLEEPVLEEPVLEQPVVEQPVVEQPSAAVEMPAPIEVAQAPAIAPVVIEAPAAAVEAPAAPVAPASARRERAPEVAVAAPAEPAAEEAAAPAAEEATEAPVASDLPETPSREDVQAAIAAVRPSIEACADPANRGQTARVRFTFASSGRTSHALVEGVTGPTASCVARNARSVSVPAFSRDRLVVEFPFQL